MLYFEEACKRSQINYSFQIYAQVTVNGVKRIGPIYTTDITVNGGIPLAIALAIAFGIMVFVIVALAAGFCFWKRRNPAHLQVVRMADGTGNSNTLFKIVKLYV